MIDINMTLEPYYTQIEKIFIMRNEYGIDSKFFKKALKCFMKMFLYDGKYIRKIRRWSARRRFKRDLEEMICKGEIPAVIHAVEVLREEQENENEKTQEDSKDLAAVPQESEVVAVEEKTETETAEKG